MKDLGHGQLHLVITHQILANVRQHDNLEIPMETKAFQAHAVQSQSSHQKVVACKTYEIHNKFYIQ